MYYTLFAGCFACYMYAIAVLNVIISMRIRKNERISARKLPWPLFRVCAAGVLDDFRAKHHAIILFSHLFPFICLRIRENKRKSAKSQILIFWRTSTRYIFGKEANLTKVQWWFNSFPCNICLLQIEGFIHSYLKIGGEHIPLALPPAMTYLNWPDWFSCRARSRMYVGVKEQPGDGKKTWREVSRHNAWWV